MKPNTTQRSWSNYEGDRPIKSFLQQGAAGAGRGYQDSPKYKDVTTNTSQRSWDNYVDPSESMEGKATLDAPQNTESDWRKLQRSSKLRSASDAIRKSKPLAREYDEDINAV